MSTQTRYCRNDGVLGTTNTGSWVGLLGGWYGAPSRTGRFYSDVYLVHQDLSTTLIGSNIAMSTSSNVLGFLTGTWSCPKRVIAKTDKIRVIQKLDCDGLNLKTASFTSEVLGWAELTASIWSFKRHCDVNTHWIPDYWETTVTLMYGDSGHECVVSGIGYLINITPVVSVSGYINISVGSSKFEGLLDHDGYDDCDVRFAYREKGEVAWNYTAWQGPFNTSDTFDATVTGLSTKEYEVVAWADNDYTQGSSATYEVFPQIATTPIVACLGDDSNHGGELITSSQDGTVKAAGVVVAVAGAQHKCPIEGHGTTSMIAGTSKSYINGKLILTYGAIAGCGAQVMPPDRKVNCE